MELVEGGVHVRHELFYGEPEAGQKVLVLEYDFGGAKLQVGIILGNGRRLARRLPVGTREIEGSQGAGGGLVGRAEKVTAEGTVVEGLVAAGTVGPRSRVAARAVETAEVSGARGCGAVGATKVARLAKAGCRAAGATKVGRLVEAGGCCAAGATKVARVAEAGGSWAAGTGGGWRECVHSPDVYGV